MDQRPVVAVLVAASVGLAAVTGTGPIPARLLDGAGLALRNLLVYAGLVATYLAVTGAFETLREES